MDAGQVSGAVWQAGLLNGFPESPEALHSSKEYGVFSQTVSPVELKAAKDLPQVLRSGQALKIFLDELPKEDLELLVVVNTGKKRKHPTPDER